MRARSFFYVCTGLLMLAAAYHLGTQNAGAAGAIAAPTEVAVLTGTVADGGTIPLPTYSDGTTAGEADCHWMAGLQTFLVQYSGQVTCSTSGRVVHVSSVGGQNGPVVASYMIIATRSSGAATPAATQSFGALKAKYR